MDFTEALLRTDAAGLRGGEEKEEKCPFSQMASVGTSARCACCAEAARSSRRPGLPAEHLPREREQRPRFRPRGAYASPLPTNAGAVHL